ncbi:hypothetical protein COCON_G00035160 [Conger conger]|uniref:Peroxiredoxin-like 2A n=1 Tax=Conger conger TaxID=82655 RepID=A0A9Q1DZD7_CONCO|nr:hypothetical protein COCON_G00035160 [Conger conger]
MANLLVLGVTIRLMSPAVLEREILTMGILTRGLGSVFGFVEGILRGFTDLFLTKPLPASLPCLQDADLKTLDGEERTFKAKELWQESGAVIMAEAAELSSLKPQLDTLGVPLYAVVKEAISTEVQDFRPYFAGEIFLDLKKRFYGPRERKMGLSAFIRLGVWKSGLRAFRNGFAGNVHGEGFVLGAVYVIGADQQGIVLEHREMEFGDKVNILEVLRAVRSLPVEMVEK